MANKKVTIEIGGDSSGSERAINQSIDSLDKLRVDLKKPLGKIEAFEQTSATLADMGKALEEARRKLEYFKRQASIGGDIGAKAFAADIRSTEREIDKLNTAIGKQSGRLRDLSADLGKSGVNTRDLAGEKARLATAIRNAETGTVKLKAQLEAERAAASGAALATDKAATAAGRVGAESDKSTGGVNRLATGMRALAAAAVVREFVQANASIESMTKALESVTGSSDGAKREMAFVRAEATRLGLEMGSAASSYTQLAAAAKGTALEGAQTREIWSAVAESMARLGKSSAETDNALLAISQMMSKGVVSAEELRGQLGERMPNAIQAAARALRVTTQELDEMLKSGQLVAADFLPKFAAELRKTGGSGGDVDTFNANLNRLKNAVTGAFVEIGNTGVFDAFSKGMRYMSVGVAGLVRQVEFAGKTLGNLAYTIVSMDFSGWEKRQRENVSWLNDELKKSHDAILGVGSAATTAGEKLDDGLSKGAGAADKTAEKVRELNDELKYLGIDPGQISEQVARTEQEFTESFARVSTHAKATGDDILAALLVSLDKVGREGVEPLEFAFQDAFQNGKISADQLAAGVDAINAKLRGVWPIVDEVGKAFDRMGLRTKGVLLASANQAQADFKAIRDSGLATAETIGEAWEKYAQAALASGDSLTIEMARQQASALGLTTAFDSLAKQHGVVGNAQKQTAVDTGRLADSTERLANASRDAASDQRHLADETEHAGRKARDAAESFTYYGAVVREDFRSTSDAAAEHFETLRGQFARGLIGTTDFYSDITRAARLTSQEIESQTSAYEALFERIRAGRLSVRELATVADEAGWRFSLLGEQRLGALRDALTAARRQVSDLRDDAEDMVSGLRDELDGLNKNYEAIETRRAKAQQDALRAKLASAEAVNDETSAARYREAMALLDQVTKARLAEAAERGVKDVRTPDATRSRTERTVNLNLNVAGRQVAMTLPEDQSAAFVEALRQARLTA